VYFIDHLVLALCLGVGFFDCFFGGRRNCFHAKREGRKLLDIWKLGIGALLGKDGWSDPSETGFFWSALVPAYEKQKRCATASKKYFSKFCSTESILLL